MACLASYNNGRLHGAWIDAARDVWELWDDVKAILAASPEPDAEEYAIHDYEGFTGARISEHQGLDSVADVAALIVERGRVGGGLLNYLGGDVDEARGNGGPISWLPCDVAFASLVASVADSGTHREIVFALVFWVVLGISLAFAAIVQRMLRT